ncbi:hypothetical protein EUX98_g8483 [Antrodiella citrinella]|uniref:CCHC-type domain-containing protein n=1 Tax=Antrodiella citrinella TaxID=2447956 RepID=A0A4S4M6S7_9APHY|nr:hypothetical protein EUX98_g8483 [Antrodiella citrinella]
MAPLARTPARRRSDPPHFSSPLYQPPVIPPHAYHLPMSLHEEVDEGFSAAHFPPRAPSTTSSFRSLRHAPVREESVQRPPAGDPDDDPNDDDYETEASSSYDTADDEPRPGADLPGEEKGEHLMRAATLTLEEMGRYMQFLQYTAPRQPAWDPRQQHHLSLPAPRHAVRAPKLKDPDTFNGEDSSKLQPFLLQCGLQFAQRPWDFPDDDDKIIYVISYLRGPAAEWFQAFFLDGTPAPWDGDFSAFCAEIQTNFGPHDPVGDAEDKIESCRMRDTERIAMYIVRFNQLAALTRWDDAALAHRFYRGLPARIKDELARQEHNNDLNGVRDAARRVDARYWQREEERKRETPRQTPAGSARPPGKATGASSPSSTSPSSDTPKPHADKLGKDGKLNADERARRLKENLCLYCGGKGHQSKECKRRTSTSATGRASEVAPASDPEN